LVTFSMGLGRAYPMALLSKVIHSSFFPFCSYRLTIDVTMMTDHYHLTKIHDFRFRQFASHVPLFDVRANLSILDVLLFVFSSFL
jgi:hypothetical protein